MLSGLNQPSVTRLVRGRIHVEPGAPPVAALAIRDGVVAAAGTEAEVRSAAGRASRVIELGGLSVLPAFIESHTHYHRTAVLGRCFLDFEALAPTSVDDVLAAVAERASALPSGAWIQGDSLSPARLAENRPPDRAALDRAGQGRPVVLRGIGKHLVAASSSALAAAGIDAATPDPPGGRIERTSDGTPTGILHERAKLRLDQSAPDTVVPSPGPEERQEALRHGVARLHRLGIGTLHEMVRLPEEAADWSAMHASGGVGVRIRLFYRVHESTLQLEWLEQLGIRRGLGDDRLRVQGVKISVDGFDIFRNAAVYEPYGGQPDNRGLLRIEPERLQNLVARANAHGLQVAVHAVGVRAVDAALDAFEAAGPAAAGPHRIEHAYVDVDEERLRRIASLGLVWSTQPVFRSAYTREWAEVFEPERRQRLMPLAAAHAIGVRLLFNSDSPCASVDPMDGIRAATDPYGPNAAGGTVDRVTAWRAFTTTAADVSGEPRLGRLHPGCHADLVAFDGDPLDPCTDLNHVAIRATMLSGDVVYDPGEVFA
jgi:predicted amidohydrolase YtcJ